MKFSTQLSTLTAVSKHILEFCNVPIEDMAFSEEEDKKDGFLYEIYDTRTECEEEICKVRIVRQDECWFIVELEL